MGKVKEWKTEISSHKYLIMLSVLFLVIATLLNYAAGNYADKKSSVPVPDLILDHIPTLDLDIIFVYGATLVIIIIFVYPLFFKVKELHVVIGQISLLYLIRSFFLILTHLNLPANALVFTEPKFFGFFDFKNELFFSGHTAIPFLGFLLFRKEKIGKFFLIATIVMMVTVLFMHVHYSIDVFAALFITYGSYKIGEWVFKKINHY